MYGLSVRLFFSPDTKKNILLPQVSIEAVILMEANAFIAKGDFQGEI